MSNRDSASKLFLGPLGAWFPAAVGIAVLAASALLRGLSSTPDPLLFGQLQFTCGILAITFAGAAFVRFQGTRDRLPLILAASFIVVGVTLASSSVGLPNLPPPGPSATLRDPMTWVIGRTLLAILLVSALLVERRYAFSRHPVRDIAGALALVVTLTIVLSASHRYLPPDLVVLPGRFVPRPGNMIPAAFFLLAALFYHRRLKSASSPFDWSLYFASAINFWCSIAAAESERRLDAAFALAAVLQFGSYVVLLGGTLFDIEHLFQNIRRLAVTESVTGLANYRHLIESLELEMQRTGRTGRPFALVLFDLDRLKQINDQFGHQVGTRALCRAAEVMRTQSRAIDTCARHGGDEFALVLPETPEEGVEEVMNRVCSCVAGDGEHPPITLSAGFAIYPQDGVTVETLMDAADRSLYKMKEQHRAERFSLQRAAG